MYFPESEAIVGECPDLLAIVEQIDRHFATIFAPAPLRAADFSCAIGCDTNQVQAAFELLAGRGVLRSESMVECQQCQNLMSGAAYHQAMDDEDGFDCSTCGRRFSNRAQPIIVYRMTPELLARPKPDVPIADATALLAGLANFDCVFQRQGQMWVAKFDGVIKFMQDSRGMLYIARLLTDPMRDILAVSLLAAAAGIDPRVATGASGPLLDDQARLGYGDRLRDLHEELENARQDNDIGRIDRAQEEMETLGTEIFRATGLAGRKRQKTDAERVRKSVSMAVSRAIESIAKEHESLGRHLTTAISSGVVFRYAPEQEGIVWLT